MTAILPRTILVRRVGPLVETPREVALNEFTALLCRARMSARLGLPAPLLGSGYRPSSWCQECHAVHYEPGTICPACLERRR